MSNWFKAALVAALLIPAPALAQTQSLAGAWELRATNESFGCVITGQATLTPTRTQGVYTAAMSTRETCGDVVGAPVGQRCTVSQSANRVSVLCTVTNIDPGRDYLPDDFELFVSTTNRLTGRLTANWNAPAEWRRTTAAIS